jgi:hypothetical protein
MYPAAKFIHIVRHPRDVIVSGMYHRYREFRQAGQSNWLTEYLDHCRLVGKPATALNTSHVIEDARNIATSWRACVDVFSASVTMHPGWLTTIRYEDLIANTPRHLSHLCRLVSLDSSPSIVKGIVGKTHFKKVTKGREPGMEDPYSHARKGVPGDWVNYLLPEAAQAVLELAQTTMTKFGYATNLAYNMPRI